jgi:hypothetical protein
MSKLGIVGATALSLALRPVYNYRLAMKAATRLMNPVKQASVFS